MFRISRINLRLQTLTGQGLMETNQNVPDGQGWEFSDAYVGGDASLDEVKNLMKCQNITRSIFEHESYDLQQDLTIEDYESPSFQMKDGNDPEVMEEELNSEN